MTTNNESLREQIEDIFFDGYDGYLHEKIDKLLPLIAQREQAAELRGAIKALKKSHGSAMISYKTDHSFEFVRGWNSHRSEVMKELARLEKLQATKSGKEKE